MPQEDSLPFISLVAHKRLLQGRTQHRWPVVKLYSIATWNLLGNKHSNHSSVHPTASTHHYVSVNL